MGKKGPMPTFETVDDYMAAQPENIRKVLEALRSIIHEAAPDIEEVLFYKVPCFKFVPNVKGDQQIMMAGYKKFVSLYPFPSTIEHFKDQLKGYKLGTGTVQFPLDQPLPKELIKEMVSFRRNELLNSNS